MKNSKSGKIATKFVKDSVEITAPMLSIIFNRSISRGVFPKNLKIGKVYPIYKGKGSKSDPDNYRPITVLSVIARLFDKLVHEQLFLYFNDYLYKKQSGFRPSKYSTQSALLNTSNQWLLNIDKGDYNLAVFLDLRKAFDTVNHNLLLKKLKFYGIQGIELQWFESYLSKRQQYCSVNHHLQLASVKAGIPQGSSLGPLLFLIYINDLPCALEKSEPDIYADDTGVFVSGRDMKILKENVNLDLQHVYSWLHANKLSLNTLKCKYMIIGSKFSLSHINYIPSI